MFLKAKKTRVQELETDIRRRVDELRAKIVDPETSSEEREKARGLLDKICARIEEEKRVMKKGEK